MAVSALQAGEGRADKLASDLDRATQDIGACADDQ
jgi:hypothetical protein